MTVTDTGETARAPGHARDRSRSPRERIRARLRHGDLGILPVVAALVAIWLYFYVRDPIFVSPRNLSFLLLQIVVIGTIALGVSLVLLLGEIDLSIAAVAGTCAAITAVLTARHGLNPVLAIGVGLAAGALIGAFHGFFMAVVRIPSFVVTLAGLLGFQGALLMVLGRTGTVNVTDPIIRAIATTYLPGAWGWGLGAVIVGGYAATQVVERASRLRAGLATKSVTDIGLRVVVLAAGVALAIITLNAYRGVPLAGGLLIALVALFAFVTRRTRFGRSIYAVGGNAEAARRAGINVTGVRISCFMLCSMLAATGGVIGASRFASVSYTAFAGGPLLLEAIAAAVIGGISLFGGRGSIWGALLGALVIGSLSNGLDLQQAATATKLVFSGAILLAAVTLDAFSRRGGALPAR